MDNDILNVEDIVKSIIKYWGSGNYSINSDAVHEAKYLKLDISKSINSLGWKPKYSMQSAIEKTALWYKNFYENKDNMYEYSMKQIKDYAEDREV